MTPELLTGLQMKLDGAQLRLGTLQAYYEGRQPFAFLAPESKTAVANRLDRLASNVCKLAVISLAERLRVTGLTLNGAPSDRLWQWWLDNDLDDLSTIAHREALAFGSSYAIVWAGADGMPSVSIESAQQVATLMDPGTRQVTAALKRWSNVDPVTGAPVDVNAVYYGPDEIVTLHADTFDTPAIQWTTTNRTRNPLGVVPVVPLVNGETLLDANGTSEMQDVMPLSDALNKLMADMMVSSEYAGRPRRWATGIELEEDEDGNAVNPFPGTNRMMTAEDPASRFGQLPAADLSGYGTAAGLIVQQIAAVSGMPSHYLGVKDSVTSADALRASEASLATRAEDRQRRFGRSWRTVAQLMVAVTDGVDPRTVRAGVTWADPTTASAAQEADAAAKLVDSNILTTDQAAAKLGATTEGEAA